MFQRILASSLFFALYACGPASSNNSSSVLSDRVGNGQTMRTTIQVHVRKVVPTQITSAEFVDAGANGTGNLSVDAGRCATKTSIDFTSTTCDGQKFILTYSRVVTGPLFAELYDKKQKVHFRMACTVPASQLGVDVTALLDCKQKI